MIFNSYRAYRIWYCRQCAVLTDRPFEKLGDRSWFREPNLEGCFIEGPIGLDFNALDAVREGSLKMVQAEMWRNGYSGPGDVAIQMLWDSCRLEAFLRKHDDVNAIDRMKLLNE